jgi:hypothetical protein
MHVAIKTTPINDIIIVVVAGTIITFFLGEWVDN